MNCELIERDDFLKCRWDYRPGEHVAFFAPTQQGKTTFAFQLMNVTASEKLPAITMVMKPRDATVRRLAKEAEFPIVKAWPPPPAPWKRRPAGHVLWPVQKPTHDPAADEAAMYHQFRRAIIDVYRKGDRILFADELYGLTTELRLTRELIAILTRGAGMGGGLWSATQKPSHVPTWVYSQSEHLFLGPDPDKRNRDRFSEIGGVDPELVKEAVTGLRKHQWVYIRRTGPQMCLVGA